MSVPRITEMLEGGVNASVASYSTITNWKTSIAATGVNQRAKAATLTAKMIIIRAGKNNVADIFYGGGIS